MTVTTDTAPTVLRALDGTVLTLALDRWLRSPAPEEGAVLDRAVAPVLDVGCGPGRHTLERRGAYRASTLNEAHAADADTLLALDLFGEPLHIDHGFPVRLIGPNRPGVMQTKWVTTLVVR